MTQNRKLILISNDDGYQAKGIHALVDYLRDIADIIVCAPVGPRSGFSRSFTIDREFELSKLKTDDNVEWWSCSGTPVDCIKIAFSKICVDRKPDMVIGGINHGNNSSINAHYSGTIGVVLEGCIKHVPSVAFSLCHDDSDADFSPMRTGIQNIVHHVLEFGLPERTFLNINYPNTNNLKGIKICRMGYSHWPNEVKLKSNEGGIEKYHVSYEYRNDEPDATDTDAWALDHGYVAITPITLDVTDYLLLKSNKLGNIKI